MPKMGMRIGAPNGCCGTLRILSRTSHRVFTYKVFAWDRRLQESFRARVKDGLGEEGGGMLDFLSFWLLLDQFQK